MTDAHPARAYAKARSSYVPAWASAQAGSRVTKPRARLSNGLIGRPRLPERSRGRQRRDPLVIISKRPSKDLLRVLTQQGCRCRIDSGCKPQIERRLDVGNHT